MGMAYVEEDPKPACKFGNTMVAEPLQCPFSACVVVREVEEERDQISSAYNLMHSALIKEKDSRRSLEQQRDQLTARVERLVEELQHAKSQYVACDCNHPSCRYCKDRQDIADLLSQSPAASLLLHDADLLSSWGVRMFSEAYPKYEDKIGEGHYIAMTNVSRMMHEEANKLRKQAEDLEQKP